MTETEITICVKCRYHRGLDQGSPRAKVWYNQICIHPDLERPLEINPVSGEKCYHVRNDLGRVVPTEQQHPNCRDINDGHCRHFEPR